MCICHFCTESKYQIKEPRSDISEGEGLHEDRLSEQEGGEKGDGEDGGGGGGVGAGHGVDVAQVAVADTILLCSALGSLTPLVVVSRHGLISGREVSNVRAVPLHYFTIHDLELTEVFVVRTSLLLSIQGTSRDDSTAVRTGALKNIKYLYAVS